MIDIEEVYAALWAKVSAATGFVTTSRRPTPWDQVPSNEQPALFMQQGKIKVVRESQTLPAKYTITADLLVYAYSTDDTVAPATLLNPLVKAVGVTLDPTVIEGKQTLGLSNVSHCWIEGEIETDEGVLGNQAVAIIPIRILAAE